MGKKPEVIYTALRLTPDMRTELQKYASKHHISEAEAVRRLAGQALGFDWTDLVKWGGPRGTDADPDQPDTQ